MREEKPFSRAAIRVLKIIRPFEDASCRRHRQDAATERFASGPAIEA
jgi:hypothetical protein